MERKIPRHGSDSESRLILQAEAPESKVEAESCCSETVMKDEDRGDLKDQSFEGPLVIVDSDDRVPEEKPNRSSSVAHPNELSIELPDESFQEFSQDIQVLDEVNELSGDEQPSCSTEVISTDELKSICVGIEPKESDDDEILVLEDCHFDEFEDGEFEVQDEEMEAEEFHSEEIDGQLTEMKRKRSEEMRTVLRVSSTHTLVESDEEEQIFVVKDELVDDVTQASSNNLEEKIVDKDATVIDNNSGSVIDMSVLSVENVVDDSGLEDFESALIQYGKMTETSLQLSCALCGDHINSVKNWVCHHFQQKHRKVIALINHFRNKCIENLDSDAISKLQAKADELKGDIHCNKVNEFHTTVYCAVCCVEVESMKDHVTSLKHLVAYMNVLYPMEYVNIKLESLNNKQTKLNFDKFRQLTTDFLVKQLPKTEDSPLEMVVLVNNDQLSEWLNKYIAAMHKFTEKVPKPTRKTSEKSSNKSFKRSRSTRSSSSKKTINDISSYEDRKPNSSSAHRKNSVFEPMRLDQQISDLFCIVCRTKNIPPALRSKHEENPLHLKKFRLSNFVKSAKDYEIVNESCTLQAELEKLKDPIVGVECITVFRDSDGVTKFWICSLCWVASKQLPQALQHLTSGKHALNYIEDNYQDVKPVAKDIKTLTEELLRLSHEIIEEHGGLQKVKVALVKPGTEKVLSKIIPPINVETAGSSTFNPARAIDPNESMNDCATAPTPESMTPKILSSTSNEDLLWCDACYLVIMVNKARWSVETAWLQHIKKEYHKKKWKRRQTLTFDESGFIGKDSVVQQEILKNPNAYYFGLNDIIERRTTDEKGSVKADLVCLLCADQFPVTDFKKHIDNKIHLCQFVHRNYPEFVKKLFFDPKPKDPKGAVDLSIENFLKDKTVAPCKVRVYDASKFNISKAAVIPSRDLKSKLTATNGAGKFSHKEEEKSETEAAAAAKELARELSLPNLKTDKLVKILIQSNTTLFRSDEKAYIQERIDSCTEPLIGLQNLYEFQCIDPSFEPGYLCKVCSVRMLADDVISHIVSNSHRLAYMEINYKAYHQNIKSQTNAGRMIVITKQYAAQIERQEGRKLLTSKLTMKVDSSILNRKKPAYIIPTVNLANPPVPPNYGTLPLSNYPPYDTYCNPPPIVPWPMSSSPHLLPANQLIRGKHSFHEEDKQWSNKCTQFLQKLDGTEQNSGGKYSKPILGTTATETGNYHRRSHDQGTSPERLSQHEKSPRRMQNSHYSSDHSRHSSKKESHRHETNYYSSGHRNSSYRDWIQEEGRNQRSSREEKMSKNLASQRSQEYREKRRSRSRSKEGTKRRKYDEEPERSAEYKEKIGWNQSSSQQKTYGTHYPPVIHEKQRLDPTKPNPYNRCSNYEENKSSLNISALLPQKETKPMQANTAAGRSVQADTSFHSLLESLKGPLQQQPSSDATQDVSALLTALGALDAQSEGGPGGQQHQLPDRAAGNNVELLMKLLLEQKERQKQEHEKEAFLKLLLQDTLQSGLNQHRLPFPSTSNSVQSIPISQQSMSNSLSRPTWSLGVPMPWPQASQPGLNAKVLAEIMGTGHPRPISTPGGFWSQPRPEVTQMASGGNSSWNHPGGLPRTQLLGQETQLKTKDAQLKDLVEKKRMESLAKMNQMTSSGGHSLPSNMNAATAGFYQPQISGYFGGQNLPTAAINHLGAIEAARNLFSGGFMPNHSRYGGNQPAPMGKK